MIPAVSRIGPNAIIQVTRVLERVVGSMPAAELMTDAGLGGYLLAPPQHMVDEREVIALHAAVRRRLGPAGAGEVLRQAGTATGDYLLAHRIPRPAQLLLRALPAQIAARVLVATIARHAWTFAGSGRFAAQPGRPLVITIVDNPICRGISSPAPVCDYFAATFERLFQQLVHPRAAVIETQCAAAGAPSCRFEIDWRRPYFNSTSMKRNS